VALLEKRRYLNNHSGDFPQVILIVPSHVPNKYLTYLPNLFNTPGTDHGLHRILSSYWLGLLMKNPPKCCSIC
jgi:hypothetical protein